MSTMGGQKQNCEALIPANCAEAARDRELDHARVASSWVPTVHDAGPVISEIKHEYTRPTAWPQDTQQVPKMSNPPTQASTSKIARPFASKRVSGIISSLEDAAARYPRATAPSALNTTNTKQYRAALSTEAKPITRTRADSRSRPTSPTKKPSSDGLLSRPKTPTTPRKDAQSPTPFVSEMDVSRIDPEDALIDAETVDAGDVSADEAEAAPHESGREDKVLVSIRYVIARKQTIYQLK
jgi:hypothetical protein